MSDFSFTFFNIVFLFCCLRSCVCLLASGGGDNGGRAACYCCSCCSCSCCASSYRSSAGTAARSVSSISSAQIEIVRLLRHPRRALRPPSAMLPRVLPGLLEQHDDVLHVSWEMGSERFVEEVEMEARKAKRSVEVLDTEERKKKLTPSSSQPRPNSKTTTTTAATAPSHGSRGWMRTSSSCPR